MDIKTHNGWVQLEPTDYVLAVDVFVDHSAEDAAKHNLEGAAELHEEVSKFMRGEREYKEIKWTPLKPMVSFHNRAPAYVLPYEGYKGPARKGEIGYTKKHGGI